MRASLTLTLLASAAALAACSHNNNAANEQSNAMMASDNLMANDMMADNMMGNEMPTNDMMGNTASATPTDAAGFIAAAGASDMFEIQSAKLALANSKSDDIHKFANMMIADHTKTTDAVKAAAKKAGLTPAPPQLTADQQQVLGRLLKYGPSVPVQEPSGRLFLVVPRLGTISPWASKASDIAGNCGLQSIQRLERGIAYYVAGSLSEADAELIAAELHDRMTQRVLGQL